MMVLGLGICGIIYLYWMDGNLDIVEFVYIIINIFFEKKLLLIWCNCFIGFFFLYLCVKSYVLDIFKIYVG